jgi:hypothetical protein
VHKVQCDISFLSKEMQEHAAMLRRIQSIVQLPQIKKRRHVHAPACKYRPAPNGRVFQLVDVPRITTIRNILEAPRVQEVEGIADVLGERRAKVSAEHDGQAMIAPRVLPVHVAAAVRAITTQPLPPGTCASSRPAAMTHVPATSYANPAPAMTSITPETATASREIPVTAVSEPVRAEQVASTASSDGSTDVLPTTDAVSANHAITQDSWPAPEDDDYDPAKPEYLIPTTLEERARDDVHMLDIQIAALEGRLEREDSESNKKVTDHYLHVVHSLQRSRMKAQQVLEACAWGCQEEQHML